MLNIKFMRTTTWMPRAHLALVRTCRCHPNTRDGGYYTKVLGSLRVLNLIRLMAMGRLDDL